MKKYAALLLTVVSVAGLAWAGVLTLRMALRPAPMLVASGPTSLHAKDGEDALQRLRRIDQVLTKIEDLKPLVSQMAAGPLAQLAPLPLPLPLPPPLALAGKPAVPTGQAGSAAAIETPVISMVYLSTDMQRAVINGKLYASGDSMFGGGRVVSISLNEVVIDYKGKRKVLPVPRSQVSASTSRPASAK